MKKEDKDFLELYLKSYASISVSENIVICDDKGYILFATNNFIKTLPKKQSLIVGNKLDNLSIPKNKLYIEEKPIISPITGHTLAIEYKFNKTSDTKLYVEMQQEKQRQPHRCQQKNSQPELIKLELQKKLAYLGYDESDLAFLILYILSHHNVFFDSESTQVEFLDLKGQLIYKTPNLISKNHGDSVQIKLGADTLISPLSGKFLAQVKFSSKSYY